MKSNLSAYEMTALRTLLINLKRYSSDEIEDMLVNAMRFYGADMEDSIEDGGWEFDEVAAEVGIELDHGPTIYHAYFGEGLLLGFDEV